MTTIIIAFVIGLFVGAFLGLLAASLCVAASRADEARGLK